jgi:hypothetical protein
MDSFGALHLENAMRTCLYFASLSFSVALLSGCAGSEITQVSGIRGAESVVPGLSLCQTLQIADHGVGIYTIVQIDLEPNDAVSPSNRIAHIYLELDEAIGSEPPDQLETEKGVVIDLRDESAPPLGEIDLTVGEQILLAVRLQDGDPTRAIVNPMTVAYPAEGGWNHPAWSECVVSEATLHERTSAMLNYLRTYDRDGDLEFDCPGDAFEINPSNPLVRDCSL